MGPEIKIENCLKAYEIYENSQDKKNSSQKKGRGIVSSISHSYEYI